MTNKKPIFRRGDLLASRGFSFQLLITKVNKNSYEFYHCLSGKIYCNKIYKNRAYHIDFYYTKINNNVIKIINYNDYWAKLNEV